MSEKTNQSHSRRLNANYGILLAVITGVMVYFTNNGPSTTASSTALSVVLL